MAAPYVPTVWVEGVTKLGPTNMNHLETGVEAASTVYNVKAFGARGDGTTDDTAAINAAIVAASSAGGAVYLPPGTYKVTGVSLRSNVSVFGAGMGLTTIKLANATNAATMSYAIGGLTNVEIRDLTVDGNRANQSTTGGAGIVFPIFTKSAIRRVLVQNTYGVGIQLFQGSDLTVEDCYLTAIGQGNSSDGSRTGILAQTVTRLKVTGNTLNDINDSGILATLACTEVTISGNTVFDCYFIGVGLGAGSTRNAVISDNVIKTCAASNGIDTGDATGVTVTGNVVDNCYGGICPDLSGLLARTAADIVISNNKISNITTSGILVIGPQTLTAHGISIIGNIIDTPGQHGIGLSAIRDSIVSANTIRNYDTGSAGFAGLRLDVGTGPAGCQGLNVVGNRFYEAGGYGIDRGTGGSGATNNNNNVYVGNSFRNITLGNWTGTAGPSDIRVSPSVTALTYSATIATDATNGPVFTIVATNGTAFTISTPSNPQTGEEITYDIKNSSGGAMGAITWGAAFLLAGAFTNPANGKRRTITFYYDGTNWIERYRAAADI